MTADIPTLIARARELVRDAEKGTHLERQGMIDALASVLEAQSTELDARVSAAVHGAKIIADTLAAELRDARAERDAARTVIRDALVVVNPTIEDVSRILSRAVQEGGN